MLYLVFLVLISVASVTPRATKAIYLNIDPERAPIIFNIFKNCAEEIGIDSKLMEKVIHWNFEDNEPVHKYLYCFLDKSGYSDADGHFLTDKLLQLLGDHKSKDQFINAIDECNKLKGSNKYDTVYKISVCFRDTSPILFKL